MSDTTQIMDRSGRVLGARATKVRGAMLQALRTLIDDGVAWRDITVKSIVGEANDQLADKSWARSHASFYQYFETVEEATLTLYNDLMARGEKISGHLTLILALMTYEERMREQAEAAYMEEVAASREDDVAESILDEVLAVQDSDSP